MGLEFDLSGESQMQYPLIRRQTPQHTPQLSENSG